MTNPLETLTKPPVLVNQTKTQLEEKIKSITEGALPPEVENVYEDEDDIGSRYFGVL